MAFYSLVLFKTKSWLFWFLKWIFPVINITITNITKNGNIYTTL